MPNTRSQSRPPSTSTPPVAYAPSARRTPDRAPNRTPGRAAECEIKCVDQAKVERARQALPGAETMVTLAETLRALGDPTRLRIVAALAAEGVGELCVCDLAVLVGVSDSAVSHSLRTLRQLRLVRYRKAGKIAYYALTDTHVARLVTEGVQHVEDGTAPVAAAPVAAATGLP